MKENRTATGRAGTGFQGHGIGGFIHGCLAFLAGLLLCHATTVLGAAKPNLTFYAPSGWPSGAFLTSGSGSTSSSTSFKKGSPVYLRIAVVNNGSAAASPYATSIEVEKSSGSAFRSWEPRRTSSLAANTYYLLPTYELTDFVSENSAGTYTVTIKIDSRGSVSESSENDNSRVLKFSVTEPNVLTLGGSNRSFPAAAAKDKEVGVTANVSWTAKPSVPWLTVKTTGGKGNGKIVYNVAANNGAATRTGKITVAGGGLTRTYTVKQSGYEEILKLGGTSRSFSAAAAGGKEVGVTANVSWKAKSSVSWLTVKTTGGKGNGKIVYNVAANKGADRTGKITVTGTKKTVTYTVKQNGAGEILKLGGTSRSLPAAAAGGKEVAVTANVSWKAKSSASWLTLKSTGGKGNGKIVYSVAANKGSGTRTGKITVTGTKKTATYTVSQTAPTGANKYAVLVGINNYL